MTNPVVVTNMLLHILLETVMNFWRMRSTWTASLVMMTTGLSVSFGHEIIPTGMKAANELPEADRPRPCTKINKMAWKHFSDMLRSKCQGIPSKTVENLVRVFGGADLLNALVEADIRTMPAFLKPNSLPSSFQFQTWNGSTRNLHLEMSQPTPGVWCMAQRSQELLQS